MAVRIDRVYTKAGDTGSTSLVGGVKVAKSHLRLEAYGTVDELNAVVGLCRAHTSVMAGPKDLSKELDADLSAIQQDLFNLGADLATPIDVEKLKNTAAKLMEPRVEALEGRMDVWQESLKPLTSFVLPGGSAVPASLHLARTVCRRAERDVVRLAEREKILGPAIVYLNRLSDFFFVASRYVAHRLGEPEVLWKY